MSGPKTAHYTVSEQQRRALEIQRQTAQERAMMELWKSQLRGVLSDADKEADELRLFSQGKASPALTDFLSARTEAARLIAQSGEGHLNALRERNRKLQTVIKRIRRNADVVRAERRQAEQGFRAEIERKAFNALQTSFAAPDEPERRAQKNSASSQWVDAVRETLCGSLSEELRERGEEILQKASEISDGGFLQSYCAITIQPFIRECRMWQEAYERDGQEYEEKLARYRAAAEELGLSVESIPFSTDAVTILNGKLHTLEQALQLRDEQAYLRQCVDETMEEMGYALIGSRELTRRNGKKYRNELYLFDEGTAVSVTRSEDGQIVMELGGLGTENRLPKEQESAALAVEMGEFCRDYDAIEQRLKAKGIETRRLSVLPPDVQFAQIINMSDYEMTRDVPEFAVRRKARMTPDARRIGE